MPKKTKRGNKIASRSTPTTLSELVNDDDFLIDLIVDELSYHKILASQVGLPDLLRQVRDLEPDTIIENISKKGQDEDNDRSR